jgi:hypothetical protein
LKKHKWQHCSEFFFCCVIHPDGKY